MRLRRESCASSQLSIVMLARAKVKHVRSLHRMMCDAGHLRSLENLNFPTRGSQEPLAKVGGKSTFFLRTPPAGSRYGRTRIRRNAA